MWEFKDTNIQFKTPKGIKWLVDKATYLDVKVHALTVEGDGNGTFHKRGAIVAIVKPDGSSIDFDTKGMSQEQMMAKANEFLEAKIEAK